MAQALVAVYGRTPSRKRARALERINSGGDPWEGVEAVYSRLVDLLAAQ